MITLFTIGCPKCKILERKLHSKNIEYKKVSDIEVMKHMGLMYLPILDVDGERLDFSAAIKWINKKEVANAN